MFLIDPDILVQTFRFRFQHLQSSDHPFSNNKDKLIKNFKKVLPFL